MRFALECHRFAVSQVRRAACLRLGIDDAEEARLMEDVPRSDPTQGDRQEGPPKPWLPRSNEFLMWCNDGAVEKVRMCLDLGFDATVKDPTMPHCSGIHFAAARGHRAVVALLLDHRVGSGPATQAALAGLQAADVGLDGGT